MSSERPISIRPLHWPSDSVYEYSVLMSDSGDRAVIFAVSFGHFNEGLTSAAAGVAESHLASWDLGSQEFLNSLKILLKRQSDSYIFFHWVALRHFSSCLMLSVFGDGLVVHFDGFPDFEGTNAAVDFSNYIREGFVSEGKVHVEPIKNIEVALGKTCYVFGRDFSDGRQVSNALRTGKLVDAIEACKQLRAPLFEIKQ